MHTYIAHVSVCAKHRTLDFTVNKQHYVGCLGIFQVKLRNETYYVRKLKYF